MSEQKFTSKAELAANKCFKTFYNHRLLLLFAAMLALTGASIYFNMRLGRLSASPNDFTWWVMPAAYSFLDVALLCLGLALFAGAVRGALGVVSWVWFYFLLGLSLFACLSCIIALDAENSRAGDAFKRAQLERSLAAANANVETWQRNVQTTVLHRTRFNKTLSEAEAKRDAIAAQIHALDSATPPNLVVFKRIEPFLPPGINADDFRTLARLVFGFALVITPLVCGAVLSQVFGRYHVEHGGDDGGRKKPEKTISPGEKPKIGTKWPNFNSEPVMAEDKAPAVLNVAALEKVRKWLMGESGRVTRAKIKYRSGNLNYDDVSLIINELLRTGHLVRMGNGQLKVGEFSVKAVLP